jgi:hypothetical protein
MTTPDTPAPASVNEPPPLSGSYGDAETLRKWSFLQRTPQQRLDWLIAVLKIAYQRGALKPRQPAGTPTSSPP